MVTEAENAELEHTMAGAEARRRADRRRAQWLLQVRARRVVVLVLGRRPVIDRAAPLRAVRPAAPELGTRGIEHLGVGRAPTLVEPRSGEMWFSTWPERRRVRGTVELVLCGTAW